MAMSQSPQTGQVYFNSEHDPIYAVEADDPVTIPSNGSSLFQCLGLEFQ